MPSFIGSFESAVELEALSKIPHFPFPPSYQRLYSKIEEMVNQEDRMGFFEADLMFSPMVYDVGMTLDSSNNLSNELGEMNTKTRELLQLNNEGALENDEDFMQFLKNWGLRLASKEQLDSAKEELLKELLSKSFKILKKIEKLANEFDELAKEWTSRWQKASVPKPSMS